MTVTDPLRPPGNVDAHPLDAGPYWDIHANPGDSHVRLRPGGFKHLLVPALAAACLADQPWRITNAPDIADTRVLSAIVTELGAKVTGADGMLTVDAGSLHSHTIPTQWSSQIHGGVYLLPTLLATRGQVASGAHGGCRIGGGSNGARPMAHMATVMERFGARCAVAPGNFQAWAPPSGLRGTVIDLAEFGSPDAVSGKPTGPHYSGATKTALLLAATANGTTVLRNPYPKPDVTGLAHTLAAAGASIRLSPTEIVIDGRGGPLGATQLTLPSDLMEVITFIAAAVCLDRHVTLTLEQPEVVRAGLAPELRHMDTMGLSLSWNDRMLEIEPVQHLRPAHVVAASHLVYSDAQPLFALMMLKASGPSRLTETVWRGRFGYVSGLRELGAHLEQAGDDLLVRPSRLRPAPRPLRAGDLRAAMALVIAALSTGQPQRLYGVEHLARGYAEVRDKLARFGARIDLRPNHE
ncbi:UDP-N-acetylglucosamine 1-carboxyvinyltransferase [Longimycelium tulufanense]|uniref:UDP-N-acetylglucosamine 1-carboxyvinyltransferase n=1 Tax=Longimycelium tulufanense TaxID=907463 RepID=A0A8J3CA41_9PSEU|nr:hypothetical protein [Longimycelium tulufanense]GGM48687.1 UDP-N-acetylglucosamine 1-carboxyvinyltransferase [Longimycelium tulufanense]